LLKLTDLENEDGNFVDRRSFVRADDEDIDAVPLIDGIILGL